MWERVEIQKRLMESVNFESQPDHIELLIGALNHFDCIYLAGYCTAGVRA